MRGWKWNIEKKRHKTRATEKRKGETSGENLEKGKREKESLKLREWEQDTDKEKKTGTPNKWDQEQYENG